MIILNLKDGLGNQLFEYTYARQLQNRTGEIIYINSFFYKRLKGWSCSLHNFELNNQVKFLSGFQQYIFTSIFFIKLLSVLGLGKTIRWIFRNERPKSDVLFDKYAQRGLYYSFKTFNDCSYPQSKSKLNFIHGNYESPKYLDGILPFLRNELKLISSLSIEQQQLLTKIQSTDSVCVHIRRGDYLNPEWASFNVCDFRYYNRGMLYIKSIVHNATFFIFSNTPDDIKWIKDNYLFDKSLNIEYVNCKSSDVQDFELMKSCNHFVISNSTFSWWAANLQMKNNKIVVAPSIWSKTMTDSNQMFLKEWIKL